MAPARIAAEVVANAVEIIEGDVRVRVDAEFDCGLRGRLAIPGDLPRHRQVLSVDQRAVIGPLDDEASIRTAAKAGHVQRIDAPAIDLECPRFHEQRLLFRVDEDADGTDDDKHADHNEPPERLDRAEHRQQRAEDCRPEGYRVLE
jgi:hypothetical protein